MNIHWKDWCWSWSCNNLATWCEELTHWKRPWCWERLRAEGEGGDRRWDGWMASPTQWTWVWVNSGRYWWTEKPGIQSMGSQSWSWLSNWTTTAKWYSRGFWGITMKLKLIYDQVHKEYGTWLYVSPPHLPPPHYYYYYYFVGGRVYIFFNFLFLSPFFLLFIFFSSTLFFPLCALFYFLFSLQTLVSEGWLSIDGSEGAALLPTKPRPRSRSSTNGLAPGSPRMCGVWRARGRTPFLPCPVSQDEGLSTPDPGQGQRGWLGTGYLRPTEAPGAWARFWFRGVQS